MGLAEDYLTVAALAERLHVSHRTILRAIQRGELPAVCFARRGGYRIRESDAVAWLATLPTSAPKQPEQEQGET
jgi:excisionase family DNA binding protein